MSTDPTEAPRRARIAELAAEDRSRAGLEARYGKTWTTDEMTAEFEALGFMAPLVVVRRRSDLVRGSLEFTNGPEGRFYFNWKSHKE